MPQTDAAAKVIAGLVLCLSGFGAAAAVEDPFGWEKSGFVIQGQEHYWSTKVSQRRGVVGLDEVSLVELSRLARPAVMKAGQGANITVYAIAHHRVYNCSSGAYRTLSLYVITSPDVLAGTARQNKVSFEPDSPDGRGTAKTGSPERRFLDEMCSR
ncbi:MAG: hypothetical protein ACREQZ_02115 [Woeseiaceae bacterium]